MSKSTALTEKLPPVEPKHYVWWFPGSPLKVHLDFQVVRRLKEHLQINGRHSPVEGLLFGATANGTTEILDFQPVTGRHSQDVIAGLTEERKRALVGYYRTEPGETLRLNGNDLLLADECFAKPHQVFLLIQSTGFDPPNATFFFRDSSRRMADYPFLEFAFDPVLLAYEERDKIQRSLQTTNEQPRPVLVAAPITAPPPTPPPAPPPHKTPPFRKAVFSLLVVALLAAVAAWLYQQPSRERLQQIWAAVANRLPDAGSPADSATPVRPSMSLRARRQNGDLELNWNSASPLIANATSGVISIQDGANKRSIPLDATQVRGGSLLYSPTSDQIVMQLTVTTPTETATESVMVISPKIGAPTTSSWPQTKPPVVPMVETQSSSAEPPRPSRPFHAPPVTRHDASAPIPLGLDSPVVTLSIPSVASLSPGLLAQAPVPPPPAQSASPASAQQAHAMSSYQPPVPINKTAPAVPAEMRSLLIKPITVDVKVWVDATGKVIKAEALASPNISKLLTSAAVNAARTWRFEPAQRGNDTMPSELTISFVFRR